MIADEQGDIVERLETKKSTERKKETRGLGGGGGGGGEKGCSGLRVSVMR